MTKTLSSLALDAAVEVEKILSAESTRTDSVHKLAKALRKTPGLENNAETFKSLASPTTLNVFSRAVSAYSGKQMQTVNELVEKLNELLGLLEKPDKDTNREALQNAQGFCLALHRELLLRRTSEIAGKSPSTVYRV